MIQEAAKIRFLKMVIGLQIRCLLFPFFPLELNVHCGGNIKHFRTISKKKFIGFTLCKLVLKCQTIWFWLKQLLVIHHRYLKSHFLIRLSSRQPLLWENSLLILLFGSDRMAYWKNSLFLFIELKKWRESLITNRI